MTDQPPQDPQQPGPPPGVPSGPPPGWYPDPDGQQALRWWSGMGWTPHTQPLPDQQPGAAPPGAGPGPAAAPQSAGHHSSKSGSNSHWVRNIFAAIGAVVVVVLILSHLGSGSSPGSSTDAAGSPGPSPSAPAAASQAPCTTHSCIVTDAETLKGTVAKDNSVMTKVSCRASTVKQVVSGTYTVHCTTTYSDDSVWDGIATVLLPSGNVDWEPTYMVSAGNSGD